jgi:hypothetical protein
VTPVHFYHLYVGIPGWRRVALEHFQMLSYYAFSGDVRVGVVGPERQRRRARLFLNQVCPEAVTAVEADEGFEQVTLSALHDRAQELPAEAPVLYAHAKGSVTQSKEQELWRACMSNHVIGNWRSCVGALKACDAVGAHWVTAATVKAYFGKKMPDYPSCFGGNFWWANAGYLAALESPATYQKTADRWDAEWWIGSGSPKVCNLEPSWPFHPHRKPEGKPVAFNWRPGAVH